MTTIHDIVFKAGSELQRLSIDKLERIYPEICDGGSVQIILKDGTKYTTESTILFLTTEEEEFSEDDIAFAIVGEEDTYDERNN